MPASTITRRLFTSTISRRPDDAGTAGRTSGLGQELTPSLTARRAQAGTGYEPEVPVKVREWIAERHARQHDVVDLAPAIADEARILEPRHRLTDREFLQRRPLMILSVTRNP
jgi:hypothetical protein